MKSFLGKLKSVFKNRLMADEGQGIVEYALVLAFVVVIAAGITTSTDLKEKVKAPFANMVIAFEWWGG